MCESTFDGNKVEVCKVGDLKPGQRYRDPQGSEYLVAEGHLVVDLTTGATASTLDWTGSGYRKDTRLGTDRQGRLYASRYLNPTPTATVQDEQVCLGDDLTPPPNTTTMGDI